LPCALRPRACLSLSYSSAESKPAGNRGFLFRQGTGTVWAVLWKPRRWCSTACWLINIHPAIVHHPSSIHKSEDPSAPHELMLRCPCMDSPPRAAGGAQFRGHGEQTTRVAHAWLSWLVHVARRPTQRQTRRGDWHAGSMIHPSPTRNPRSHPPAFLPAALTSAGRAGRAGREAKEEAAAAVAKRLCDRGGPLWFVLGPCAPRQVTGHLPNESEIAS